MAGISDELAFAKEAAQAGAEVAIDRFGGSLERSRKGDGSWVTDADEAVEAAIRQMIAAAYPAHNVLGEEGGLRAAGGGEPVPGAPTWIVDPIDGTNNFMLGVPVWGTLVGLKTDGEIRLGVCHAPALDEIYEGELGGGARCNDRPISADDSTNLEDAVVLYSSAQAFFRKGLDEFFEYLIRRSWRSRGFGDFWGHMLVARGAAQVMVEPALKMWDVAALLPIVTEAGATLTHLHGEPWGREGSALTTSTPLHDEVVALAQKIAPDWREPATEEV
ncbi:MAG: inositol monophosphatase family protein [Actinomycetota bacterium]